MSQELYVFNIIIIMLFISFIGLETQALIYNIISSLLSFVVLTGSIALNWITYNTVVFYFVFITSIINMLLLFLNRNNRKG